MNELIVGFVGSKTTLSEHRGERVARWVEIYLRLTKCSVAELAFRIRQDRRCVQRLLETRSCGHRLEDALAAYFGWPFVEAVMAPIIEDYAGVEIARERAEIAAREDRIQRLMQAGTSQHSMPRMVDAEDRSLPAPRRIGP